MLIVFFLLMIVVYGLVFFTGSREATPKLGIDLQGGTRVTLTARTPDGSAPSRDQLDKAKQIIEQRVNGLGVSGSEVIIDGDNLVITVPGDDGKQARTLGQTALLYVRPVADVQAATPQPNAPPAPEGQTSEQAIAEAKALRQAPKDANTDALRAQMAKMNCDPSAPDPLQGNDDPEQYLVTCSEDGTQVYLLEPQIIKGSDIDKAEAGTTQGAGAWIVRLDYKGGARDFWSSYTAQNIGKATAFTLDSKVVSAPQINGAINGTTEVSGDFTQTEAKDLANVLKYGSLPLSFKASDAQTVSATLGWSSLKAGLIAGLIGLIAVFIYALAYYRMLGILTVLSLTLSGIMVYGIMVLLGRYINFTLDLAGIAGLIIGIGMTADSFVVYFERIKDEMREGRSFRSAVPRGWARAKRTIWSGNAVSLISAGVLYFLAVGDVKGFAFTLGLTTILDVAVVFLVTYPLVVYASRSNFLSKPSVNGLGGVTQVAKERRQAAAERPTTTMTTSRTSGGVRNG
ncbi:protein translocase subunit SecD [Williamsia sp. D3]|uniref:protein translocase subunit SecD n=1 Tax=Williamsia sp. D3 TaxID=1313067 RepID=UPI0003D32D0B|nr:protein translocase subunit SecD [Williamsia sp. D3]ETD31999.1 preprotein translocase subunit SecD [Williamsia sp. D3]